MLNKKSILGSVFVMALASATGSARADSLIVDLAGWTTHGGLGSALNTSAYFSLAGGTEVTGYSYAGLAFSTSNGSFIDEFVISVNSADGSSYMDWAPSLTSATGTFGPAAGFWGGPDGVGIGGPFVLAPGANNLWLTVYETTDDPFGDNGLLLDATVSAGTLTISYTSPIPEPGTFGLLGLGLLGVAVAAARRGRA